MWGSEVLIYGYGAVCLSMIVFNIIYNIVLKKKEPGTAKKAEHVREALLKIYDGDMSENEKNRTQADVREFLKAEKLDLGKSEDLLTLSQALSMLFDGNQAEAAEGFIEGLQPLLPGFAESYLKKDSMQTAYFAVFLQNYRRNSKYDAHLLDILLKYASQENVRMRISNQGKYETLMDTMAEVIEKDARSDFRKSFSLENIRTLVSKRVRDFGGDFLRKFGDEYRWVNVHVLFDESLAPEEVVLCFREMNAEKQQQLKECSLLEDALAASRQSEKTKQAFFSNMSHDMRTPLNAIIGLSELAEKSVSNPDKTRDYIQKIKFSGRHLLELINDILDMSRMEQGNVEIERQEFDIQTCILDCVDSFRFKADMEKKKLNTTFKVSQSRVIGDAFRITQLLNNLLSNAFKFTEEGDTINIELSQVENQEHAKYKIIVSDTGLGMSEEFLERIFEPYARETRFSARRIVGTGLGMSIVKSIVDKMEGHINVESQLGKGTTFTLVLPLEIADDSKIEMEIKASEKEAESASFSLAGRKILLVEDNEINMELATELLSMHGIEITQAWNGKEAVDIFCTSEEYSFDAVLMDMQMPVMNGCEAAKLIRTSGRADAQSIPIIAVTANAFAEDIAATAEAGMNAHISKPIDFKVLCSTLEKFVKGV